MGYQRQKKYLNLFEKMEPGAQNALRDIYQLAHRDGDRKGRHIITAMRAALLYPAIFKLTLSNIVVRMTLKRAMIKGNTEKAEASKEILDDFHHALDAFMKPGHTLDRHGSSPSDNRPEALADEVSFMDNPEIMEEIRRFQEQSLPVVRRTRDGFHRKDRDQPHRRRPA